MKLYIDALLLLNFFLDFILLLSVSLILKRNVKIIRIVLGSLVGALTIFSLFFPLDNLRLFIIKLMLSLIIIIVTFGYKNLKYLFTNLLYFYFSSIILGGVLYFINLEFSTTFLGMIFYNNGVGMNYLILMITSPVILYLYYINVKKYKNNYSLNYKVDIYLKDGTVLKLNGYLDTANKLIDPYKRRNVLIVNHKELKKYINNNLYLLVPYQTIDNTGFLKTIVPTKVIIHGVGEKSNVVVALSNKKFNINGINCIFNNLLLEEK